MRKEKLLTLTGAALLSASVLAGCAADDEAEGEYLLQEDVEQYYNEEELQIWAEEQGYIAEEDLGAWVEEQGYIAEDDLDAWAEENGLFE